MPCAARNNNHFEIISPDTQVRNRFYILGVRKVKKKIHIIENSCQHKYVLYSMQKSIGRDISAVLLKNYCNACEISTNNLL